MVLLEQMLLLRTHLEENGEPHERPTVDQSGGPRGSDATLYTTLLPKQLYRNLVLDCYNNRVKVD